MYARGGKIVVAGSLPGCILLPGELPATALMRLLDDRMGPFRDGVHVEHVERSLKQEEHKNDVATRTIRNTFVASLDDYRQVPTVVSVELVSGSAGRRFSVRTTSSAGNDDTFKDVEICEILTGSRETLWGAWVWPHEFDRITSDAGRRHLTRLVKNLRPSQYHSCAEEDSISSKEFLDDCRIIEKIAMVDDEL